MAVQESTIKLNGNMSSGSIFDRFNHLQIKIASPSRIMGWSFGEVTKPETINYRTLKPEKDGLFCERIFGPTKDWECYCGKYKRIRYRGIICDKCGVEVTQSKVRRERMGHISLAAPVSHIWFFKGAPSKLSLLLDISPRNLEKMDLDLVAAIDSLKAIAKVEMEKISETLKQSLVSLKAKVTNKETLQLKVSELELKAKNKIASLKKQLDSQTIQTEEIYKALKSMVKKINLGIILSEDEYLKLEEYEVASHLRVGMGAESLLELVQDLQLDNLVEKLRLEMNESKGARRIKATKRLRVIEGMQKAQIDPTWMFLSVLPVIPPDLRPMVQLSGGRFATSDLNDLYRRVINRNNRLKHLI